MIRKLVPLTLLISCFAVTACSPSSGDKQKRVATSAAVQKEIAKESAPVVVENSARPVLETQSIDRAIQTALNNAEAAGNQTQVTSILGQLLSRNPDDAILATRYARALRESGKLSQAKNVLSRFVTQENPDVQVLTEMAMTELGIGNYSEAKAHALRSTALDLSNARGYLALGTAQDAVKDHANAEQSFRQGLKHWQGDPSPILNNLALNLASQGHLEESLSLLERALKISPKRLELERNRRIIATLLETANPLAPSPQKKPNIIIPETAKPFITETITPAPVASAPKIRQEEIIAPHNKIKLTPIDNSGALEGIIEETVQ